MIALRLVLPEGLGAKALETGLRGWFGGWGIEEELLAVAMTCSDGEGDPVCVPASARLLEHWAIVRGKRHEQLIPWIRVRPGTKEALERRKIRSRAQLEAWVHHGASLDLPSGQIGSCCLLELASEGVIEHLVTVMKDGAVLLGKVEIIPEVPTLSTRPDGLRSLEELRGKSVAVVGVGSGGAVVALHLAAAGAGTLHLFDPDYLALDNLFRHICDMRHLGRPKANALCDVIKGYNFPTKTIPHRVDAVDEAGELWDVLAETDLVVAATDNVPSRRLLNYACVLTSTPLILGCTFENAQVGEIIRVLPGVSPCYECTRISLEGLGVLEAVSARERPVPYAHDSRQTVGRFNRGTRVDVALVASLVARVAINTLLAGKSAGEGDLPTNYISWGVTPSSELPPPFQFTYPFSVNWVPLERAPDCPVCSALDAQSDPSIKEEYEAIIGPLRPASAAQEG